MQIDSIEEEFQFKGSGLDRTQARDTGKMHLSDIAKYIDLKMQFTKFNTQASNWDLLAAAEVGFLWEDCLSLVLGNRYAVRIGEIEVDNIVGSPDGVGDWDPYGKVLITDEEYKATWRSANKPPEDNWYWMTQFKSYCHMLGTTVTILRVLYINGNYKGSGPMMRVFRIEYTYRELLENWQMVVNHRDEMLQKGYWTVKEAIKGIKEEL